MKKLTLLFSIAVLSTGCFHTEAQLHGVLDMRSDGSGAAADEKPIKTAHARDGFEAVFSGDGVQQKGAMVTVEDRQHYVLALVPIVNDQGAAELHDAVGTGALRDVHVGNRLSGTDAVWVAVGQMLSSIPVIGLVGAVMNVGLAPWTVTASGTRIATTSEVATPPPVDAAPPTTGQTLEVVPAPAGGAQ